MMASSDRGFHWPNIALKPTAFGGGLAWALDRFMLLSSEGIR